MVDDILSDGHNQINTEFSNTPSMGAPDPNLNTAVNDGVPVPGDEEDILNEDAVNTPEIINLGSTEKATPQAKDDILESIFENTKKEDDTFSLDSIGITIPLSDQEAIRESALTEHERIGAETWREERDDVRTKAGVIYDATSYFQSQTQFNKDALTLLKEQLKNINALKDLIGIKPDFNEGLTKRAQDPDANKKVLSGMRARGRFVAQILGMRRVPLWNSGFYITIKPWALGEIAEFTNMIRRNHYYYTRELGGFFYLYADHAIKELILNTFLPRMIMDCNLNGWSKMGTDILKYISILDYDTILWAFATLMFRDGVSVKYYCAEKIIDKETGKEEECGNIDTQIVDLSKLRIFNMDLITKEMIDFMNSQGKVTPEKVLIYQKNIGKDIKPFRFTIDNRATGIVSHYELVHRIPPCDMFLMYGNEYNNTMFEALGVNAENAEYEDVVQYIQFNYYKLLLPWIDSISEIRDINGDGEENIIATVKNDPYNKSDREDMKIILDTISMENVNMDDDIDRYIKSTRITHIAYQYEKCPKCGTVPHNSVDGLIPYDVQTHFFTMCLIRRIAAQLQSRP